MTDSTSPPRVALVFPGQGAVLSCAASVGHAGGSVCPPATETPEGRAVFRQAEEFLGLELLQACRTSDTTRLSDLYVSQVAQVVVNVAAAYALFARHSQVFNTEPHGASPSAAGQSLGEVAAMIATGHLSLVDGLRVTHERAKVFDRLSTGQLANAKAQGMCVVQGLDRAEVETLCLLARNRAGATDDDELVCSIGIDLFPRAVTVGGHRAALDVFVELAKSAGAHKVRVLKENAAGHTTAIASAAREFRASIKRAGVAFRTPSPASFGGVVYSNLTASVFKPDEWDVSEYFYLQNISTVRWQDQISNMAKEGYRFVDMGPGDGVTSMLRQIPGVDGDAIVALEDALAPAGDALLWPERSSNLDRPICSFPHGGRTWSVHAANVLDVRNILDVQDQVWSEDFRLSEDTIRRIIGTFPGLQLKFMMHAKNGTRDLVGFIIAQRICDPTLLRSISSDEYETIGDSGGRFIFPYAINVRPDIQSFEVSDVLFDLVLWYFSTLDADGIVGVTRVHRGYPNDVLRESIASRDWGRLWAFVKSRRVKDPILKFHTLHGARFVGMLPGFREYDESNAGCGIEIDYTEHMNRLRRVPTSAIGENLIASCSLNRGMLISSVQGSTQKFVPEPAACATKALEAVRGALFELGYDSGSFVASTQIALASMEHLALCKILQRKFPSKHFDAVQIRAARSMAALARLVENREIETTVASVSSSKLVRPHEGGEVGDASKLWGEILSESYLLRINVALGKIVGTGRQARLLVMVWSVMLVGKLLFRFSRHHMAGTSLTLLVARECLKEIEVHHLCRSVLFLIYGDLFQRICKSPWLLQFLCLMGRMPSESQFVSARENVPNLLIVMCALGPMFVPKCYPAEMDLADLTETCDIHFVVDSTTLCYVGRALHFERVLRLGCVGRGVCIGTGLSMGGTAALAFALEAMTHILAVQPVLFPPLKWPLLHALPMHPMLFGFQMGFPEYIHDRLSSRLRRGLSGGCGVQICIGGGDEGDFLSAASVCHPSPEFIVVPSVRDSHPVASVRLLADGVYHGCIRRLLSENG